MCRADYENRVWKQPTTGEPAIIMNYFYNNNNNNNNSDNDNDNNNNKNNNNNGNNKNNSNNKRNKILWTGKSVLRLITMFLFIGRLSSFLEHE